MPTFIGRKTAPTTSMGHTDLWRARRSEGGLKIYTVTKKNDDHDIHVHKVIGCVHQVWALP